MKRSFSIVIKSEFSLDVEIELNWKKVFVDMKMEICLEHLQN